MATTVPAAWATHNVPGAKNLKLTWRKKQDLHPRDEWVQVNSMVDAERIRVQTARYFQNLLTR